ncbi:MAG: STAS domain-containing protein [Thermoanaerobaculia bacterium]|nr:STAS domain-containing protein [Thermoanaerobaculia bacterium]
MEVAVDIRDEVVVVSVSGSIDALTASELSDRLESELEKGRVSMVGDLEAVEYTSSAGLRVLLAVMKDARQRGGDFRLARVRDPVRRVLDLSGFTSILKIFDDLEEAVRSFR